MTLTKCLERCLVVELRSMARRQDIRLHSLLKRDIVSQLQNQIMDRIKDGSHHADLSEAAQSALALLLDRGGVVPLTELESRFGQLRRVIPGAIDSCQPWGDGQTTSLDELHGCGLLFHSVPTEGATPVAMVPVDILERLRPASVPRPKVFRACAAPFAPTAPTEFLCHNIMLLASALQDTPVTCKAGGVIPRRDLFRLNSSLLKPEDIQDARTDRAAPSFFFLRSLAQELCVVVLSDGRLGPGPSLPDWLELSPRQRHVRTIIAYVNLATSLELDTITTLTFSGAPQASVLASARQFLLALLEEAEPGEWYTTTSLVQAARARNSFLIRSPGDGTLVRCSQTGRELTARDWTTVEGAWLEACLRGPLYWLGLVEPGYSRRGDLTSFRVRSQTFPYLKFVDLFTADTNAGTVLESTFAAQQASGTIASAEDIPVAPVTVRDDLEVTIDSTADLHRWFQLERICDLISRDTISRYRISREKVRQRLQCGESAEAFLSYLGASIPQPVAETIGNWSNRFGQVRVFSATILSAAEPALMGELKAVPQIAECLDQPLGSRAYTIAPGKEETVINLLESRGEMPYVMERPMPAICPEGWQEIQHALTLWQEIAHKNGVKGPSAALCQAVLNIVTHRGTTDSSAPSATEESAPSNEVLSLLEEAVKSRRTIVFVYAEPGHEGCRLVAQPKGLVQQGGVNFISAFPKGGSRLIRYRVDCIKDIAFAGAG